MYPILGNRGRLLPAAAALAAMSLAGVLFPAVAAAQGRPTADPQAAAPRLTKAPKLIRFVEAAYPEEEKASGRQASVVLRLSLDGSGRVTDATVLQGVSPAFDAAARNAALQFGFEPAEVDDKPSPIRLDYRYDFVLKEAVPTTGILRGVVREKGSGRPLPGISVAVDTGESVQTDASGRFELREIAPGARVVRLSGEGLPGLQTGETLTAGEALEATYDIELAPPQASEPQDDLELVVVAPALSKQVVATAVSAEEGRRVAGTQGDVLKVVESLPGVGRASAGSGDVVVWGAAPEDTRVYVGGVRVPLLYHYGGLRSVIHSDLVRSVELVPGAYGSPYGRGLGGLILVDLTPPPLDRTRASVQVDVLDAAASLRTPLSSNTGLSIAARRSHLGALVDRFAGSGTEDFFTIPDYYDAQARFRIDPAAGHTLELGAMLSSDAQTRSSPSADPSDRKRTERSLDWHRFDLRYRRELPGGAEFLVVPWFGRDERRINDVFGSTPTRLESHSALYGLRTFHRARPLRTVSTTTGLDFEWTTADITRSGSVTAPAREGDPFVFGRAPADQVSFDHWTATTASVAPYVQAEWGLLDERLQVTPGLRFEPYFTNVSRRTPKDGAAPDVGAYGADLSVQPRLAVTYSPIKRLTFKAATGRYRQAPAPEDLSAVFGNPLLGTSRATHYLVGVSFRATPAISIENSIFHTRSRDLPVRSSLESPLTAQALVGRGEGRTLGSQFLLRHDRAHRFFGWLAYTLLRSERKDGPGTSFRLFDYDQTHVLTALAAYDLGAGFDVGTRVRAATGYPRTPVEGAFYDARRDRYEPVLGARNSTRIPPFFQADARIAKRLKVGKSELEAYLDVQNVTFRENPEELAYSPDYEEDRLITGLPFLPVLGLRWSI
jgi:TonB family protein